MGIADLLPGISGGTIAFITGIYEKLIESISNINLKFLLKLKIKDFLKSINFIFFIPLGLGILTSIFFLSKVITYLINNFESQTYSFFFGLILASAYILWKKTEKINSSKILVAITGFILAYLISSQTQVLSIHSLPIIFISGAIAICALLLPGISGALILVLLNQYQYILQALHDLNLKILSIFIIGGLTGLFSFSKLINYLLKKYKTLTLSCLTGIMLGSLKTPATKMFLGNISLTIILILFGFFIIFKLEKKFNF